MNLADRRLVRHLAIAVVLKLAVLALLWQVFVRDARVPVDAAAMGTHATAAADTGAGGSQGNSK